MELFDLKYLAENPKLLLMIVSEYLSESQSAEKPTELYDLCILLRMKHDKHNIYQLVQDLTMLAEKHCEREEYSQARDSLSSARRCLLEENAMLTRFIQDAELYCNGRKAVPA
jgi:hypothetical protein